MFFMIEIFSRGASPPDRIEIGSFYYKLVYSQVCKRISVGNSYAGLRKSKYLEDFNTVYIGWSEGRTSAADGGKNFQTTK